MIQKIFMNPAQISKGKFPFDRDQWLDIQMGLMVYASQDVFKKYLQVVHSGSEEDRGFRSLKSLGELIMAMRKEVGFNDDKLTTRECLSTIIFDINDKKYDDVFKNDNVITKKTLSTINRLNLIKSRIIFFIFRKNNDNKNVIKTSNDGN
jgi:hypothetical protein